MGYLIAEIPECREYLIPGTWASEAKLELATNLALRPGEGVTEPIFQTGDGRGPGWAALTPGLPSSHGERSVGHPTPDTKYLAPDTLHLDLSPDPALGRPVPAGWVL